MIPLYQDSSFYRLHSSYEEFLEPKDSDLSGLDFGLGNACLFCGRGLSNLESGVLGDK